MLPTSIDTIAGTVSGLETTTAIFQTVRIGVDRFVVDSPTFGLSDVQRIVVGFSAPPSGRVAIDDVELEP